MEKLIDKLNERIIHTVNESYPISLFHGEMGLCIYFYYLYRIKMNVSYKNTAECLLDDVLKKLSDESSISVEDGLAGVALGVIHLIRSGFVEGDANELLKDIDDALFKHLVFPSTDSSLREVDLLHLLYYFHVRLSEQTDVDEEYVFQGLIWHTFNDLMDRLNADFLREHFGFSTYSYHLPVLLFVFGKLLKWDFCREKVYKALEQLSPMIWSHYPVFRSNRLFLLCGLLSLFPFECHPYWKDYADLLYRGIELDVMVNSEFKNKQIFISNGLSMIYILLSYLNEHYPDYKIDYDPTFFYDRIMGSEAWTALEKPYFFEIHHGLLNGFPGANLVLSHIQKQCI